MDGEADGDNRGNNHYTDTDTELRNRDGAEAVSEHQGDRSGEWEISEELDDEIWLGSHKERHKVKR